MAFNNKSWHSIKTHQLGIVYLKLACKATKIRGPTWKNTQTSGNFSFCVLQFNREKKEAYREAPAPAPCALACARPTPAPPARLLAAQGCGTAPWPSPARRPRTATPRAGPRLLAACAPRHRATSGRRGAAPSRPLAPPTESRSWVAAATGRQGEGARASGAWRGESMEDGRRC